MALALKKVAPPQELTEDEINSLFDFSDDEESDESTSSRVSTKSFEFSKYSETETVFEDDDLDYEGLLSSAVSDKFSYEKNAQMEINTIRTALDKEANLHLLGEEPSLQVQGHLEIIKAKETQFKNALKTNKIDNKTYDELSRSLHMKVGLHLAELSLSKTAHHIRGEIKLIVPKAKSSVGTRPVRSHRRTPSMNAANALQINSKRISLSNYNYADIATFGDKLNKLCDHVSKTNEKAVRFFGSYTEDSVIHYLTFIHEKYVMLQKKVDTMQRLMFSRYANDWKRKAFGHRRGNGSTSSTESGEISVVESFSSLKVQPSSVAKTTDNLPIPTKSNSISSDGFSEQIVTRNRSASIATPSLEWKKSHKKMELKISTSPNLKEFMPPAPCPSASSSPKGSPISLNTSVGYSKKVDESVTVYTYDQLRTNNPNHIQDIDASKREMYLSDQEFRRVFLMDRITFYSQKSWKQDQIKKSLYLY